MGDFTAYFENEILNDAFGGTPATYPDTYYVGLWTSPIDGNSDGNAPGEPTDSTYERKPVARAGGFSAPAAGQVTNVAAIQFDIATVDWGMITHVGLCDAETGGNLLATTAVVPIPIVKDDIVIFRTGDLMVALD